MNVLKAGLTYFALVFGAGFVLGAVRVAFLVPRFGVRIAELMEMPVMLLVITLSARFVVHRFTGPSSDRTMLSVGLLALALLVAAELALVVFVQGQTIGDYIARRDPVSGSVYLALLVVFALMPLVLLRVRERGKRSTP